VASSWRSELDWKAEHNKLKLDRVGDLETIARMSGRLLSIAEIMECAPADIENVLPTWKRVIDATLEFLTADQVMQDSMSLERYDVRAMAWEQARRDLVTAIEALTKEHS
jgi:hypothetical protein